MTEETNTFINLGSQISAPFRWKQLQKIESHLTSYLLGLNQETRSVSNKSLRVKLNVPGTTEYKKIIFPLFRSSQIWFPALQHRPEVALFGYKIPLLKLGKEKKKKILPPKLFF